MVSVVTVIPLKACIAASAFFGSFRRTASFKNPLPEKCRRILQILMQKVPHESGKANKRNPGRQYSLIGSRDSTQSLGLVPTAVTWLNKLGDDDRSKCGPNTVHVTSLRLG